MADWGCLFKDDLYLVLYRLKFPERALLFDWLASL